jgi:uncharacterized protein
MVYEHGGGRRRETGLRVVLDTNVYVSAFQRPEGLIARVWQDARKGMYALFASPHIVGEVAQTLREDFRWSDQRVQLRMKGLVGVAKIVVPAYIPDVIKEDPDDNHILACALAGNANLIVSRDLDLLRLKTYGTIGIMSPIDFLHTLEGFKKAA